MHDAWAAWIGRSETAEDEIDARRPAWLAATLDRPLEAFAPAGTLPPLWHWLFFQSWYPASQLGPDGHPRRGLFLPPIDHLPRRMWAGGRLAFPGELRIGDVVRRTSTIASIRETEGSSGPLVFVTVRHVIEGPRGVAVEEEQDLVYRRVDGAALRPAEPAGPLPTDAFIETLTPDPVLLFRYSALTGNGHRIHYDRPYAERVEAYPGLVVHGPLQATLLAGLLARARPGERIERFSFRGLRPLFAERPMTLVGTEASGRAELAVRDDAGIVTCIAEAILDRER